MKTKILHCIIALLCSNLMIGCATTMPKYSETIYFNDFRPYTEQGFTISPVSSGFTYTTIGDLEIVFEAGALKKDNAAETETDEVQTLSAYTASPQRETAYCPSLDEMTAKIVNMAQELGADALLNFKIHRTYSNTRTTNDMAGRTVFLPTYTVSGLAVKLNK